MTAHWGLPDPAAAEGSEEERMRSFRETAIALRSRIGLFTTLQISSLDRLRLQKEIDTIGQQDNPAT